MEFPTGHPIGNLLGWWQLAGVDALVSDETPGWLAAPERESVREAAAPPARKITPEAARQPADMPSALPEFLHWLGASPDTPEAAWGGARIVPDIGQSRRIMVISDMPDAEDMRTGALFAGAPGRLFDAMMAAIGLDRDSLYLCSLATARPPGGLFDPADTRRLADIMRQHIALAGPAHVLLLGDKTSRALLAADAAPGTERLHLLNHDGGSLKAVATFHPRFLLRHPAAKAECWKDLQMFARGIVS